MKSLWPQVITWAGRSVEILALALFLAISGGDTPPRSQYFYYSLDAAVGRASFDFVTWTTQALIDKTEQTLLPWHRPTQTGDAARDLVRTYDEITTTINQMRDKANELAATGKTAELAVIESEMKQKQAERQRIVHQVEAILERQLAEALRAEGLDWAAIGLSAVIPAVRLRLTPLPNALIISYRDKIETKTQAFLLGDLTIEEMEVIESAVEAMDGYPGLSYSALIVPIGGLSTYPTMVAQDAPLEFIVFASAHEWFHDYFTLFPLGWHYADSGQLITMNEVSADIGGREIGNRVWRRYYAPPESPTPTPEAGPPTPTPTPDPNAFNFNREMRTTRLIVDEFLAQGEVRAAEIYMEQRRQFFVEHGIYLRKLNQAFFAFYGSYADSVYTVDPLGSEIQTFRRRSGSLKAFIQRMARFSSYAEFKATLNALPPEH